METVRLGKTGLQVSRIGFGGIPIQRVSEEEAVAVVRTCLDLGITYIDTARAYTTSEERIGKAIAGRRDQVVLATKTVQRSPDKARADLELSLRLLGVDCIDLYQVHNVRNMDDFDRVTAPNGTLDAARDAQKAGLVRHIGATSHSMDVAQELVKCGHFETVMFPFNFVTSEPADQLVPLAREHDVGFIAMKPFAGGMLDNAELAFKYLLQFPDVVPIPGVQLQDEMRQIVQIVEGQRGMTDADRAEIERMRQELGTRFCRRCDYCQPCTEGIAISMVTMFEGNLKRFPLETVFSGWMAPVMEKAADCTKCGECESRCPYGLPIMEMVEQNYNRYLVEKKKYFERVGTRES